MCLLALKSRQALWLYFSEESYLATVSRINFIKGALFGSSGLVILSVKKESFREEPDPD